MGEARAPALTTPRTVPSQLLVTVAREAVFTIAAWPHAALADTATPVLVAGIFAPVTVLPPLSTGTLVALSGSVALAFRFIVKVLAPTMAHAAPLTDPAPALVYVQFSTTAVGAPSIAKVANAPDAGWLSCVPLAVRWLKNAPVVRLIVTTPLLASVTPVGRVPTTTALRGWSPGSVSLANTPKPRGPAYFPVRPMPERNKKRSLIAVAGGTTSALKTTSTQ